MSFCFRDRNAYPTNQSALADLSRYVDEYAPDEYHEIGDNIIVPVYVKTFKKNNGEIGHPFAVQQQFGPARGEHF